MADTVVVRGYREVASALNRVDKNTKKTLYAALRAGAEPIAKDAASRVSGYRGISTTTIRPRVTTRGVYITQGAKKKTGYHPYFGAIQMQQGLIPALDAGQDQVIATVEAAFDALSRMEGF